MLRIESSQEEGLSLSWILDVPVGGQSDDRARMSSNSRILGKKRSARPLGVSHFRRRLRLAPEPGQGSSFLAYLSLPPVCQRPGIPRTTFVGKSRRADLLFVGGPSWAQLFVSN